MVIVNNANLDLSFLETLSKIKENTLSFFESFKVIIKLYFFKFFVKELK